MELPLANVMPATLLTLSGEVDWETARGLAKLTRGAVRTRQRVRRTWTE